MAEYGRERHGAMRYTIDADDVVTGVSNDWESFAAENGAAALMPHRVVGRKLWDFVTDPSVRDLYVMLLRRVRLGVPVVVDLRCDAPDLRRLLRLEMSADPSGQVAFRTEVLSVEERPPIDLLGATGERTGEVLVLCSWCKKVRTASAGWVEVEQAVARLRLFEREALPRLKHGICMPCYTAVIRRATA